MPLNLSSIADKSSVFNKGRAKISVLEDIPGMTQDWRARLLKLLEDRDLSMRDVSMKAGVSHGYLHGILKDEKDPHLESMLKICDALEITLSWLLYGYEIDAETEQLLQSIQAADPEKRKAMLKLLEKQEEQ